MGALALESFGVVVAFALVPLAVYALTWIPWFVHYDPSVSAWIDQHRDMWAYHRDLRATALDPNTDTYTPTHVYYSKAWTWIPMLRPVSYFVEDLGPDIRQILAIGNPVLFWGTMWTIPYCAWAWWRKRDWIPRLHRGRVRRPLPTLVPGRQAAVLLLRPAAHTIHGPRRGVHDARPGGAHLVIRDHQTGEVATDPDTGEPAVSRRKPYLPFVWGYFAAAVGLFLWMWPIFTASRITDTMWRARVWFRGWT